MSTFLTSTYHLVNGLFVAIFIIIVPIALVKRHKNNKIYSRLSYEMQDKAIDRMVNVIYTPAMFYFKIVGIALMVLGVGLFIYYAVTYADGTLKAFFEGLSIKMGNSQRYIPRKYDYPEYSVFKSYIPFNIGFFIMMIRSLVYNRKMKEYYSLVLPKNTNR